MKKKINFFLSKSKGILNKIYIFLMASKVMSDAPKKVMSVKGSKLTKILKVEIEQGPYVIVQIINGRIFTDRSCNISVISKKYLVPFVSWQYEGEKVLSDAENFTLKGKLIINQPIKIINANLISLLTGGGGNYNYYHWLFDSLPRLFLIQYSLNLDDNTKYLIPDDTHDFQKETLAILGIDKFSYISSEKFQNIQATNLIATSHPNPNPSQIPKWIYDFLRKSFIVTPVKENKFYIYVSRADSVNSRRLINEDRLINALISLGFKIYRLSELSFSEQVSLFSQARIVIGVHGAGFANLTFAPRGTVVFELFSEQYQPNMYERISKLGELDYQKIICKPVNSENSAQKSDIFISEDDVFRILKYVESINAIEKI